MKPAELIDKQIADLPGWRGQLYARLRQLIHEAEPNLVEEWKWNTGVWTQDGMVCSVGVFKDHVKINFFKGASLHDPHKLFNSGLEAKTSRSIDFFANDSVDEAALKELIHAAVAFNKGSKS
jgi:hypothetical protein